MLKKLIIPIMLIASAFQLISQPKLEIVGGESYDWGKISPKNNPVKADIVLRNIGKDTLKIENVKPSCGCTTAPLDKNILPAGDSTMLHVSINIGGTTGKFHKSISIYTNEESQSLHSLLLGAEVVRPLMIEPTSYLQLGDLQIGKFSESKLQLKNTSDGDITITDVEVSPAELSVNLGKDVVLHPGQQIELVAKIRPMKKGPLSASVKIKTDHPDYPELDIHGYGNVKESAIFNNN